MSRAEFHLLLVLLFAFEAGQHVVHAVTSSFSIKEGGFSCETGGNLFCSGNATTNQAGALKLTPDPPGRTQSSIYYYHTVGAALYKEPIQLLNLTTKEVVSFSISFSLQIESDRLNGAADGMAFVMFADPYWIGTPGGSLGAFTRQGDAGVETLAVEFDTYLNEDFDDVDSNHVGIDIARAVSERARTVDEFRLAESDRVFGWADYDSRTSTLEVRISTDDEKPDQPFINYNRNLFEVFHQEQVWVGFSGANGFCACFSYYTVYTLNLDSSFFVLPPPASSIAPVRAPEEHQLLTTKHSSDSVGLIVAGIAAILLVTCLLAWCFFAPRGKNRPIIRTGGGGGASGQELRIPDQISGVPPNVKVFTFEELCLATNNFDESFKLGEGGFGSVYRGKIPGTAQLVAVKKVSSESRQGEREFIAEVSTISQLRHRNVVELLGWCSDGPGISKYALVYEFMPNGSLDKLLFAGRQDDTQPTAVELSWEGRFKVLGGLAAALSYLHEGWRQQVLHRDVKSSNVMLDKNFTAMLGDFGLARMSDHSHNPATTVVAGTHGYIAPEAVLRGKFSVKTDVFAFGAVALEVVCGRRIYDVTYPQDEILLVDWVWGKFLEDDLFSVVDSRLGGEYNLPQVEVALLLGLMCSNPKADDRPTMHRVIEMLAGSMETAAMSKSN